MVVARLPETLDPVLDPLTWTTLHAEHHQRLDAFFNEVFYDVQDFGAKGDGVLDDTAKIMECLTAAIADGIKNVYFPPTSAFYRVSGVGPDGEGAYMPAIQVKASGLRFFGGGRGSRIHCVTPTTSVFQVSNITSLEQDTVQFSDITFSDLFITQTLPHIDDGFACINVRSGKNVRVLNCDFGTYSNGVSINKRNTNDPYPENCIVAFCNFLSGADHNMAIELFASKWCTAIGNQIFGTQGIGVRDNSGWGGFENKILDNLIRGVNVGIKLDSGDRSHVKGNSVIGMTGASATAIQATNESDDCVVTENYLKDYVYGIWCKTDSVGGARRTSISRNHLKNSAATVNAIFADPVGAGTANSDLEVIENYVDGLLGGNGIYFDGIQGHNRILRNVLKLAGGIDGVRHANMPAGSETVSRQNVFDGPNVSPAADNQGTGSGKFVNYDHNGIDDNVYWDTGGADVPLAVFTPPQITGNVNDYDPVSSFVGQRQVTTWRLDSSGTWDLTGIAGGWPGRKQIIIVVNGTIVIKNQNAGSVAGNRVITGTGADITLAVDGVIQLVYDDTTARWRKI